MDPPNSSPYAHASGGVSRIMLEAGLALLPGIAVSVGFFGPGVLVHIALALALAVVLESLALRARGVPIAPQLRDGSVIPLAALLALAIPPFAPWWVTAAATAFAVLIVKHAFGGLGHNLFNPAMAGFVFVLVCFPVQMSRFPDVAAIAADYPGPLATSQSIFSSGGVDAVSGATVLDFTKTQTRLMVMLPEIRDAPVFGALGGRGYEWVNAAFLAGGLVLLLRRRINWRIPGALLAALTLTAAGAHAVDADRYGGVLLHLFSGATMLGAFFIATDPVTSPATPRGQLVFGAGAGVLTYVVRAWGAYPDGIAIAVLCMNTLTPLIDRFSQPRLLGAGRPTAGAGYEREPEP